MTDDEAIRFLNDWDDGSPKSFGNDFTKYMKGNPCCISPPLEKIVWENGVQVKVKTKKIRYTPDEKSAMSFMDFQEKKTFRLAKMLKIKDNQLTISKKERLTSFPVNPMIINRNFNEEILKVKK